MLPHICCGSAVAAAAISKSRQVVISITRREPGGA
jgi:hypothetical protein